MNLFKWIGRHLGWIVPEERDMNREERQREINASRSRFLALIAEEVATETKNQRLAAISRERCGLKAMRAIAKKQKKKVSHIDAALRALTNEEIKIELGRS